MTTAPRPRHTGSLRLRGTVWFARFYHHGRLVEVSTHETDKRKATRVLRDKLRTAGTAHFVAPSAESVTFEDLCDLLRRDHTRKGNRSRIEYKLSRLAESFAGWKALAITSDAIEAHADARQAQGAAAGTINRERPRSAVCSGSPCARGKLPTMPAVSLVREDNVREGFLDPADFQAFLAALRAEDEDVAHITEFAFRTLLRRGNVVGAVWPWFTLDVESGHVVGGRMRVPGTATKNKQPLSLPLAGDLLALIDRRWQVRRADTQHVFHRDGVPLRRFEGVWRAAATAIGIPGFLFHDLRRSAARALRRAGVDEQTIMRLGGWKTRAMFTRYAIVDDQDLAAAQATLDRALTTPATRTVLPLRQRG